jgi:hypothetical protein
MAIIKSKQAGNYTVLPNELFKSGLSIEGIGMLSYFLSLPHDWVIYKTKLHTTFNITIQKCNKIFKELQSKGYLISVKKFGDNGRITWEHIVYDYPFNEKKDENNTIKNHSIENHTIDFHSMENVSLLNTNKQNTNKQKKQEQITITDIFDYFQLNGYTKESAQKFFNFYDVTNWVDSKGNKVKSWKQKAQSVWFTDENKIKPEPIKYKSVAEQIEEMRKYGEK